MEGTISVTEARQAGGLRPIHAVVVLICMLINMLDGYDLLAIAFTAPRIIAEFKTTPAAMGLVFSAGLAGVGLGSFALSPIADSLGRKPAILVGLVLITLGMAAVQFAQSAAVLAVLRFATGLGIGTLLSAINTTVSEFAPARVRSLAISIYATGYPIGAALGGALALGLTRAYGWRSVYVAAAAVSLAMIPAVAALLPESMRFLVHRGTPASLAQAQRIARRVGLAVPAAEPDGDRGMLAALRVPGFWRSAALTSAGFFTLWFTSFFINNWNITILERDGFSAAAANHAGVLLTVGGVAGSILFGVTAMKLELRRLNAAYLAGTFLASLGFAFGGGDRTLVDIASFAQGFLVIGAAVGLYALVARAFPTAARATGTGVAIAVGRIGAVLGVSAGGLLIGWGWPGPLYYLVLCAPVLVAALFVLALPLGQSAPAR